MKFQTEDFRLSCGCRSVGECDHNSFAWMEALDALVDAFAKEMKLKLHRKAMEGKFGWDDPNWSFEDLKSQLIKHADRGADPVDVANFAAFWWNRL